MDQAARPPGAPPPTSASHQLATEPLSPPVISICPAEHHHEDDQSPSPHLSPPIPTESQTDKNPAAVPLSQQHGAAPPITCDAASDLGQSDDPVYSAILSARSDQLLTQADHLSSSPPLRLTTPPHPLPPQSNLDLPRPHLTPPPPAILITEAPTLPTLQATLLLPLAFNPDHLPSPDTSRSCSPPSLAPPDSLSPADSLSFHRHRLLLQLKPHQTTTTPSASSPPIAPPSLSADNLSPSTTSDSPQNKRHSLPHSFFQHPVPHLSIQRRLSAASPNLSAMIDPLSSSPGLPDDQVLFHHQLMGRCPSATFLPPVPPHTILARTAPGSPTRHASMIIDPLGSQSSPSPYHHALSYRSLTATLNGTTSRSTASLLSLADSASRVASPAFEHFGLHPRPSSSSSSPLLSLPQEAGFALTMSSSTTTSASNSHRSTIINHHFLSEYPPFENFDGFDPDVEAEKVRKMKLEKRRSLNLVPPRTSQERHDNRPSSPRSNRSIRSNRSASRLTFSQTHQVYKPSPLRSASTPTLALPQDQTRRSKKEKHQQMKEEYEKMKRERIEEEKIRMNMTMTPKKTKKVQRSIREDADSDDKTVKSSWIGKVKGLMTPKKPRPEPRNPTLDTPAPTPTDRSVSSLSGSSRTNSSSVNGDGSSSPTTMPTSVDEDGISSERASHEADEPSQKTEPHDRVQTPQEDRSAIGVEIESSPPDPFRKSVMPGQVQLSPIKLLRTTRPVPVEMGIKPTLKHKISSILENFKMGGADNDTSVVRPRTTKISVVGSRSPLTCQDEAKRPNQTESASSVGWFGTIGIRKNNK